jgi:hypothetical protein
MKKTAKKYHNAISQHVSFDTQRPAQEIIKLSGMSALSIDDRLVL